jgi:hypothetical protein
MENASDLNRCNHVRVLLQLADFDLITRIDGQGYGSAFPVRSSDVGIGPEAGTIPLMGEETLDDEAELGV